MCGCGDSAGATYSEEAVREWLGICMEGPPYRAFCRCEADVAAEAVSEEDFLEHIRSSLWLLPDAVIEEQHRRCDGLRPTLRSDGVAGVDFGTRSEPALDLLTRVFGEARMVQAPQCGATVAVWLGLQLTFSADEGLAGWAYGAFGPGDDSDPLGLHAELPAGDGTWWVYTDHRPSSWPLYYGLEDDPEFLDGSPPTLVLLAGDGSGTSLRAITAAASLSDPVIRLEAGNVCSLDS